MDEESKELVEIVVGKMLEPVTDAVATAFGYAGLDWLKELQKRNADKFARKTKTIFEERNIKGATPPPPTILLPLISAAENESRDELLDIWAKLLVAASDPKKLGFFRRDFIWIAKQLEPIDASILTNLRGMNGGYEPTRAQHLENKLQAPKDQVIVSLQKLDDLKLVVGHLHNKIAPELSPLARQFLAALDP